MRSIPPSGGLESGNSLANVSLMQSIRFCVLMTLEMSAGDRGPCDEVVIGVFVIGDRQPYSERTVRPRKALSDLGLGGLD